MAVANDRAPSYTRAAVIRQAVLYDFRHKNLEFEPGRALHQ